MTHPVAGASATRSPASSRGATRRSCGHPGRPDRRHRASPAPPTASGRSRTVQGRPCSAPRRIVLLPLLRPARRASGRGPASGLWLDVEYFGDRYGAVPRAVRLRRTARPTPGRPLQAGRAALERRRGGPPALPARALPAPRLRSRPDPEPGRLVPRRVPQRGADLGRRASPSSRPRTRPPSRSTAPLPDLRKLPGPLLPHQLPLHRDHERVQLQVHVVPRRRSWTAAAGS